MHYWLHILGAISFLPPYTFFCIPGAKDFVSRSKTLFQSLEQIFQILEYKNAVPENNFSKGRPFFLI